MLNQSKTPYDLSDQDGIEESELHAALEALNSADAVVIAASNGFDIVDGYNQFTCDQEFLQIFGDFHQEYGLKCMLQGLVAYWPNNRIRWAFLARLLKYGYLDYQSSEAMKILAELTKDIPRFVVTCNCNSRFIRAGFDPNAIFETEGSYTRLRCSDFCSDELFAALPLMQSLVEEAGSACSATSVSSALPQCPHCGSILDVAVDDSDVLRHTRLFQQQHKRYQEFLKTFQDKHIVILELGVGQQNKAIKLPLMKYAETAPYCSYVVCNGESACLPIGLDDRAFALQGDLGMTLKSIYEINKAG